LEARTEFPFVVATVDQPDDAIDRLFRKSFGSAAPREPIHFVAMRGADRAVAGYVHFIPYKPGVYLCGGLCVATSIYRTLSAEERCAVADNGSLSRWLLAQAIAALAEKQAVFAYSGDARSRRDTLALGFAPAGEHLLVQWHSAPVHLRNRLIDDVNRLGPF
jgi:hypothetical protein